MDFLKIEGRELGVKTSSLKLVGLSRQAFDGLAITLNFPDLFSKPKVTSAKLKEARNKCYSFFFFPSFLLPSA
ncbi:hypothetical protein [Microcoleus sp. N3A4]|uniref:hypothetical protein n=1 Tax=Microcoleus sp. N3A4 TaxID=3055379 RepID=UPI002FD5B153